MTAQMSKTSQIEKAQKFRALHVPFDPVILYNIWDAGSAAAVAKAGANAIATSSWSVAAAQGYADGEAVPLDDALSVASSIARSVHLPVNIDFEGGYAADASGIPAFINARADVFLETGANVQHSEMVDEAIFRCKAYAAAGADGFFIPGLTDLTLIQQICRASPLPINIMKTDGVTGLSEPAALGVTRISVGPAPYQATMHALEHEACGFN